MDIPAQNPLDPNNQSQIPSPDNGLNSTPPPPTQTPMQGGLTNTDIIPPTFQEQPVPPQSTPLTTDQIYAPSTPADVPIPPVDVPTPPQESLTPTEPVQDLSGITPPPPPPASYNPAPAYQPTPDYSQQPTQEFTPEPVTPPTPPPPPTKSSSPKGFIIGGLLALIVVGAIFAVLMLANKNSEGLPTPSKTSGPSTNTVPTQVPIATPAPTIFISPTPAPTPKTVETFINSTYKYKFDYAIGLPAPKKVEPDAIRFPKALEVVTLPLSLSPQASSSAYFVVWNSVADVPKYITDGQSQFVKVNLYTTNRFTIKKPDLTEETHYLTQKFEKTYDIMLQNAAGKISDPAFEKILNSFTFLEDATTLPSSGLSGNASQSAAASPSPKLGL